MEERSISALEELRDYLKIQNCSHNVLNISLCEYQTKGHNETTYFVFSGEFVVCALFYLTMLVVGVGCNALILAVILRSKRVSKCSVQSISYSSRPLLGENIVLTPECPLASESVNATIRNAVSALCASNILVLSVCIPVRLLRWFSYTWTLGEFMCKSVFYLEYWGGVCSVMLLTFFTLLHRKSAASSSSSGWSSSCTSASLILIWFVSATLTVPALFAQAHRSISKIPDHHYWCLTEFEDDLHLVVYEVYMSFLLIAVPIIIMLAIYWFGLRSIPHTASNGNADRFETAAPSATLVTSVAGTTSNVPDGRSSVRDKPSTIVETEESSSARANTSASMVTNYGRHCSETDTTAAVKKPIDERPMQYRKAIRSLELSLLICVICWIPFQADRLMSALGLIRRFNLGWLRHLRMATALLLHAYACLNPAIYFFSVADFRRLVEDLLSKRRPEEV